MNVEKCLKILREIKDVSFATVDQNGDPQVRIIDVMDVNKNGIYFLTAKGKNFYKELSNGKVAIVGLSDKFESIRVNGKVKKLNDQKKAIDHMFELNPNMKEVYPNKTRYILEGFCVYEGEIEYFDLSSSKIFRETFNLNKRYSNKQNKGFWINKNKCIKCELCKDSCPQKAISDDFKINQHYCLHCGLCYYNCPKNAIERY